MAFLLPLLMHCADPTPTDGSPDAPPPWPMDRTGFADWAPLPARQGALDTWEPRPDLRFSAGELGLALVMSGLEGVGPYPYGVEQTWFRYATEDRGEAVAATGLVVVPDGDPPEGGWPVVLAIHHFAGLAGPCAPSAQQAFALELALLAGNGFVLIAPDLTGLDGSASPVSPHAPLAADQTVFAAWDAVRAGRALLAGPLHAAVRDDILLWGGSQGGHGVLWSELAAPYVAPEEHLIGALAIVPPIDLQAAVQVAFANDTDDATGLAELTLLGFARWYGAWDWLDDVFPDDPPASLRSTLVEAAQAPADTCGSNLDLGDPSDATLPAFAAAVAAADWDALPTWGPVLAEQGITTSSVPRLQAAPTLVMFGAEDVVVAPAAQAPAVAALCEAMPHLEVRVCAGADHAEAALWSIPEQVAWLQARLTDPGPTTAPDCGIPSPIRCSLTPDDVPTP